MGQISVQISKHFFKSGTNILLSLSWIATEKFLIKISMIFFELLNIRRVMIDASIDHYLDERNFRDIHQS